MMILNIAWQICLWTATAIVYLTTAILCGVLQAGRN